MDELELIIDRSRDVKDIISDLMKKSTNPPDWEVLKKVMTLAVSMSFMMTVRSMKLLRFHSVWKSC